METLYFLSTLCLVLFMVLATYDGFYLHIFKYELFNYKESVFEHKTHTLRAILFPLIVWLLFIETSQLSLFFGIAFVALDLIVLAIDAYSETDSRTFMGGLPKWEYIIHLFANSLHFAAIILIIATRISIVGSEVIIDTNVIASLGKSISAVTAVNIIPGAIVLAVVHLALLFPFGRAKWNLIRKKITCC